MNVLKVFYVHKEVVIETDTYKRSVNRKASLTIFTGSRHEIPRPQPDGPQFNCSKCGLKHGPRQCPAFGKKCFVCDGRNNFAKMCIQRSREVHTVSTSSAAADSCARNTRNDGSMDTKFFVGELVENVLTLNWTLVLKPT